MSKSSIATLGTSLHTGSLSHHRRESGHGAAVKRRKCWLVLRDRGAVSTLLRLCGRSLEPIGRCKTTPVKKEERKKEKDGV